MLYPLIWQLAEFFPFATAFETILSESITIATGRATLGRWIGYLVIGFCIYRKGLVQSIHLDGTDAG
jgi:hypothetical protein